MKAIYKYPLQVTDKQVLWLPWGFKILTLQVQNEVPCIWAEVNPNEKINVPVSLCTIGTGYTLVTENKYSLEYIGTYQLNKGALVLHVHQEKEDNAVSN